MAVQTKVGSFTKTETVAPPAFQQTITGVGFQPKGIIFWSVGTNDSAEDSYRPTVGFTDGTNHRAIGWSSDDGNSSSSNAARANRDTACFLEVNASGNDRNTFSVVSVGADGFTIEWSANNASPLEVNYFAFAGSDIQNVHVGTFAAATANGNQDITDVGFSPDFVYFAGTDQPGTNRGDPDSSAFVGFAISNTQRYVTAWGSEDNKTNSDTASYQRKVKCIAHINHDDVSLIDGEADYVQPLSNGFRINWSTHPTLHSGPPIFYMAVKGGSWKLGDFNGKTSNGTQTISGLGFLPKAVMFQSCARADSTTISSHEKLVVGAAASSTARWSIWGTAKDATMNPTITARGRSATKAIRFFSEASNGPSSTLQAEADFSSASMGEFVLNWTTTDATTRQILYFVLGDSGVSPVSHANTFKYGIQKTVSRARTFVYSMGGKVSTLQPPFISRYNILGQVSRALSIKYGIQTSLSKQLQLKYNIALSALGASRELTLAYNMINDFQKTLGLQYNIYEDPETNTAGYGKPLRARITIMSPDGGQIYYVYDSFEAIDEDSESNLIKVESLDVDVAEDSAGEFTITIEDSARVLDTSVVSAGNLVLIQAAKTQDALSDGEHDLLMGYIKEKRVLRQDTNTLEYELSGHGTAIRFNERITNFSYAARRSSTSSSSSPQQLLNNNLAQAIAAGGGGLPDQGDPAMRANKLLRKLLESTEHLPLGTPLETSFTLEGVDPSDPARERVDDFIPAINEELVTFSSVADFIADSAGAVWGVTARNDVFLKYLNAEHSGITLKGRVDFGGTRDDRYKTAYIVGSWNYQDSIRAEDGFSNALLARVGSKSTSFSSVSSSSLANVATKYTALCIDNPPTLTAPSETAGSGGGGGGTPTPQPPPAESAEIGMIIPLYITPPATEYGKIANNAKTYPRVKIIVIINVSDGPGTAKNQNYVTVVRDLKSAGVTVLGYVGTDYAARASADVQADIDKYANWYQADGLTGIFFDEMSTNTAKTTYYQDLATYAKTTKAMTYVAANAKQQVPEAFFQTCTKVDNFCIYSGDGFPSLTGQDLNQSYYANYSAKKRSVLPYNIQNSVAMRAKVPTFLQDCVNNRIANYIYVQNDDVPNPWDNLSAFLSIMLTKLDSIAASLPPPSTPSTPGTPTTPTTESTASNAPALRDLAQSFISPNTRLSDLALILSRIGNPKFRDSSSEEGGKPTGTEVLEAASVIRPDNVHGHIETNKVVKIVRVNSDGTQEEVEENMPSGFAVGYFNVPFSSINSDPTFVYLNNVVYDKSQIIPNQRYWIVLFGRGQNEDNTIRWHHSDNPQFEWVSAQRIPGGHSNTTQLWDTQSNVTGPAFACSFFENTMQLIEASDSDSIEKFKLVESVIDLSDLVQEEDLAIRMLQSILNLSSKPKRIYNFSKVTAPDSLIVPGKLITIVHDEIDEDEPAATTAAGEGAGGGSGVGQQQQQQQQQPGGGMEVDAEVVRCRYTFDAYSNALGCRFIEIQPIGHLDYSFAEWNRKYKNGELTIPANTGVDPPVIIVSPPGDETPVCPGGYHWNTPMQQCVANTTPPPSPLCPVGYHWDSTQVKCVLDEEQPPEPPEPPGGDLPPPLRTISVNSIKKLAQAIREAIPGDEIVLRHGKYKLTQKTFKDKSGTAQHPIVVRAEAVGSVTLEGSGGWWFENCHYFYWYGFNLRNKSTKEEIWLFNNCTYCRFARNDVRVKSNHYDNSANGIEYNYVSFKTDPGHTSGNNRIDHNYFHDKATAGHFLLLGGDKDVSTNDLIEYNCFRNQTTSKKNGRSGGRGGGEALRIGSSAVAKVSYNATIRYNFFENCRGDDAIISNKASGNTYYRNTFWENNDASLVLRHGSNCKVIANYFHGKNGLKIYGANHVIARNYFMANWSHEEDHCPIYVGGGTISEIPASLEGVHHSEYEQTKDCYIILNTVHEGGADNDHNALVLWGAGHDDYLPTGCHFVGNILQAFSYHTILFDFKNGTSVAGNDFGAADSTDNILRISGSQAEIGDLPAAYYDPTAPNLVLDTTDQVYRLTSPSPAIAEFTAGTFSAQVTEDFDGRSTVGLSIDQGASQYSASPPPKRRVTRQTTGPSVF